MLCVSFTFISKKKEYSDDEQINRLGINQPEKAGRLIFLVFRGWIMQTMNLQIVQRCIWLQFSSDSALVCGLDPLPPQHLQDFLKAAQVVQCESPTQPARSAPRLCASRVVPFTLVVLLFRGCWCEVQSGDTFGRA